MIYKLVFILIILNLTACASQEPIATPIAEPVPVPTSENEDLKNEIARLEKLLAERDKLVKDQNIRQKNQAQVLREVNKEATRAQVKLHRLATKPSTASAIAELEVSLESLNQVKTSPFERILQIQAHRLLETATLFYTKDQFASAMNYVTQANHLINLIMDSNRKKVSEVNQSLFEFHTPMSLRMKKNVNLRKEPNAQAQILNILKKDTVLVANANQGLWLRILINGVQGWILGTMVEIEENLSP